MGYDVALYPEFGQVYDVSVNYHDNIYNVEVEERPRGGTKGERLAVGTIKRNSGGENTCCGNTRRFDSTIAVINAGVDPF